MRRETVERLRLVASVYRNAVRAGQPPTKTVARHLGISKSYAANLVSNASKAGLLDATTRGRARTRVDNPNR